MEIYIFICFLAIAMLLIFVFMAKSIRNKSNEIEKQSKKIYKTIELNSLKKGEAKDGGGIIYQKSLKNENVKKASNWVESLSYEEIEEINNETKVNDTGEDMKNLIIKPLILLVDDSLVVRKYVGDLLRKNNYDVVIKNDGWEAITFLNNESQVPEIIISDIEMPNMNGFQLIEAIRKEEKFNAVPILVISAHAESHIVLMESENIQGFIKKPFEDSDLLNQTQYLINNFY